MFFLFATRVEAMSSLCEVIEIERKGLGCIATTDIKKGALILAEKPQLSVNSAETILSKKWIQSLQKSFNEMSVNDKLDFLTLHNQFKTYQPEEDIKSETFSGLKIIQLEIDKIEEGPARKRAQTIFKVCCIFFTNMWPATSVHIPVYLKASRFNHSCQPNAQATEVSGKYFSSR